MSVKRDMTGSVIVTERRSGVLFRTLVLAALALSATLPFVLLTISSVGREWFYPALLPSKFTTDAWALAEGGRLGHAAAVSFMLATANGLIAATLAFPVGRALARLSGWRRHVAAAVVFLPIAAPPIALGTGLDVFFLRLGLAGTPVGVLLAHMVPTLSFLSLYFLGVFMTYDHRVEDEARTLGASMPQVIGLITLPILRRQLGEAVALGFLVSWSQVALTLVIGGGLVHTLPLEVFSYVTAGEDRFAAVGALLLSVPPLMALGVARFASRRAEIAFA